MLGKNILKRAVTALATMGVAAAAGFIMQTGLLEPGMSGDANVHASADLSRSYAPLPPRVLTDGGYVGVIPGPGDSRLAIAGSMRTTPLPPFSATNEIVPISVAPR